MSDPISRLDHHDIVCGGGETGRHIISELLRSDMPVVLIEQNETIIAECRRDSGIPCIAGDATDDGNLMAAGIERAAGIIISLPSDKDTLYTTMAARMLSKSVRIISSMIDPKLEPKLRRAGADRVVAPNAIGALRMASEMIRPTAVEFLDAMLRSQQGSLRIRHIVITAKSRMAGHPLRDSGLKDTYALLVLGLKKPAEDIEFNPSPTEILAPGMTLIVMGEIADLERAKADV